MGFTLDARTEKPIIDQSTANTPEAIQAVADFAAAVGHVRVGTTSQRNAYQASAGDIWDDRSDLRLYRYHADRGWQIIGGAVPYARETRSADGDYLANKTTGLLTVAIEDAPPGLYHFDFTMSISSDTPTRGEYRVRNATGDIEGPFGFDTPGKGELSVPLRVPVSVSGLTSHRSGPLTLEFTDFRATSAGTVYKGSLATVYYVRPLAS